MRGLEGLQALIFGDVLAVMGLLQGFFDAMAPSVPDGSDRGPSYLPLGSLR